MFNAEKCIVNTLESVVNQTFTDYEIIIINDGSTDNSPQIVNDFFKKQSNTSVKYKLINKANGGVSSARNIGMTVAEGMYIALLDSDDSWANDKLEKQLAVFEKDASIDLICSAFINNDPIVSLFKPKESLTHILAKDLLYKNYFHPSTSIFKKSILNDVGLFNENQSFSEDALFFIKACHIKKCVFLNIGHCFFGGGKSFFGQSGLSKNIWKMEKGELSNIFYAYSNDIINLFEFSIISSFSLLKFIRRFFLTGINRLK